MNAINKQILAIVLLACVAAGFPAYSAQLRQSPQARAFDIHAIKSYRGIPGVTDDEIRAIEALKASRAQFVYGSMPSTEAFTLPDGTPVGFATMFCDLLSELFGIPFVRELHAWKGLKDGIDARRIDFTGELTPTPERLLEYHMTYPIAERGLGVFTRGDSAKITSPDDLRGLRIGFYAGTITAGSIVAAYPGVHFNIVDVYDEQDVNTKLSTGVLDVFIADATEALTYSDTFSSHKNIFPLIYTPVSLTTANQELTPIISVVNKYIAAGGIDRLTELYKTGNHEYAKFEFAKLLTAEERAYIHTLAASNKKIPVALENTNYPTSFYNEKDKKFQGIVPDILAQITLLAGIGFENVAEPSEAWSTILGKLASGEAAMVSELLFTEERKGRFLWSETPYAVNRSALISKSDYPYLEPYQVIRTTVGVRNRSAYEDAYRKFFPNNDNLKYYDFQNELFSALERGDIDLMMTSEYEFLTLTNYFENPGYKINIVFQSPSVKSLFGFNKNEEMLCSVINKAMQYIDAVKIENDWIRRTFNYERKLADERSVILAVSGAVLLLLLIVVILLFVSKNRAARKASMQIREANERVRIMLDASPLACTIRDKNFKVLDCNEEAVKLFQLASKQEFQERFHELSSEYQPGGRLASELAAEYIQKAYEDGKFVFEWLHKTLNGTLFPAEVTLVRVGTDSEYTTIGYTRDLRKQKEMTEEIEKRGVLLSAANQVANVLLRAEPDGFDHALHQSMGLMAEAVDVDRVYIWQNRSVDGRLYCTQLYEWSESAEPQQGNEYTVDIPYDAHFPDWEETLSRGDCINSIVRDLSPTEQAQLSPQGILSTLIVPVFLNEHFWGFAGFDDCRRERRFSSSEEVILHSASLLIANALVRHEMNQRIRDSAVQLESAVEEALSASKAKSNFLAQMSHEIRTPMNAVLGITEIQLQNEELSPDTRDAFGRIYTAGYTLLGIINDVLDLSRMEAGKVELMPGKYDTASLINDTVQLNVVRIGDKPIEFGVQVDEDIPSALFGDELRIKQILNNLLSNAFKYTQAGEVVLSVSAYMHGFGEGSSDVTLVCRVSDTGQGMTEEQVNRLFEEYSRFHQEADRTIEGIGLGMGITRQLVQMMGGVILVDSEPDKGSTFTVWLPQDSVGAGPLGEEVAQSLQQFKSGMAHLKMAHIVREPMPYGSVLVVDDVETNLYVTRGLLAPYGLAVDTVLSGFEAIDRVRAGNEYDLVFMDHMMPKMDGVETTKILRDLGYARPIVALTANAVVGQAEMFLEKGFDGFISKPVDLRQLNLVLNRLIRDKQPPEVLEAARLQKGGPSIADTAPLPAVDPQLAAIFARDAQKAVAALEAMHANQYRQDDDLRTFVVNVHAMKGALANIGEAELAAFAHKLEQAGRNEETAFMLAQTPAFLDELRATIELLKPGEEDGDGEAADEDRAYLREKLSVIRAACAAYDKKTAKDALAELRHKAWSRRTREQFNAIAEHLLHSDFEEAADLAGRLSEG